MYQGKYTHQRPAPRPRAPRARTKRTAALLLSVLLLVGAAIGSTVAYLAAQTGAVENTFQYASVSCKVTEDFDGTQKSNVQVKNTGTTDAYIRATYVVNWLDKEGNIAASVPEGYSYEIAENPDRKWLVGQDGYFYYLTPVAPRGSTPGSLLTCTATRPEKPEYTLSVEILATAIQSAPAKAVTEAWGVIPPSGN